MKLFFEWATFSEPLFFEDPYLFPSRYTFSKELFFQNMLLFRTTNFVFTVTPSIFHLVINPLIPEFLDSHFSGEHKVMHHAENLSIKYYEQKFYIKFAFSWQDWIGPSIEKCKKITFWVFNKNISFSTEFQYQQFMTYYSSLTLFS